MLLQHFLENSAQRLPKKVALVCREERLTYEEINDQVNQLALSIRELGIARGDRVAILLDNSSEAVISTFAILKGDAAFVILSPSMKAKKLAYILNDCQVKLLITQTSKKSIATEACAAADHLQHIVWVTNSEKGGETIGGKSNWTFFDLIGPEPCAVCRKAVSSNRPHSENIDLDLAALIYTSGSTGTPKGVMLTHLNIVSAANSIVGYLKNREDDVILNVLPLSFDYGLYQVLMAFQFGGTVILEKSFAYPFKIVEKMIQERVTGFPGVPTIFAMLLGMKNLESYDFSSLRYMTNTGAPLSLDTMRGLKRRFPNTQLWSMYGLTECKRVMFLEPSELERRPRSVGKPMPNTEAWVVDERGEPVGPHTPGELVVRGANVMQGYWGLLDETHKVLRSDDAGEKVLYTGDVFKMDEEGFFYFVARKDDLIKSKGQRVSPVEVENCVCELEGVDEVAVVGMSDEVIGEAIKAYVACGNGNPVTSNEVRSHCSKNLESHMVPRYVEIMKALPKTLNGKIDKQALKASALSAHVRG